MQTGLTLTSVVPNWLILIPHFTPLATQSQDSYTWLLREFKHNHPQWYPKDENVSLRWRLLSCISIFLNPSLLYPWINTKINYLWTIFFWGSAFWTPSFCKFCFRKKKIRPPDFVFGTMVYAKYKNILVIIVVYINNKKIIFQWFVSNVSNYS